MSQTKQAIKALLEQKKQQTANQKTQLIPSREMVKGQKGKRLYLHATELEIRNPLTGKILSFEAKFPRDFLKQL